MTTHIEQQRGQRKHVWRIIGWGGAVVLILTPLVAMQFTSGVYWTPSDFLFAAIVVGTVGGLVEFAVRRSSGWLASLGAVIAIFSGFVVTWVNGAVGLIGSEDNPVNLWFGVVPFIAIAGVIFSRFHNQAMATAMFAAGTTQATIGLVAGILGTDLRGGIFTIILASAWIISGALLSISCRKNT